MNKRILIIACSLIMAVILVVVLAIGTVDPAMESRPTASSTGSSSPSFSSTTIGGSSTVTTAPTAPSVSTTGTPTAPSTTVPPVTAPPTVPPTTVPPTTVPPTTVPPTTVPPTTTTTTAPPPPGQVRLYTCDAEKAEVYVELAVQYYKSTGIEVILLTPAEGETCDQALQRYMQSETAPTMFCLHQQQTLEAYAGQLYDLSGTKAAEQLYSAGFGMYYEEKLLALPVAVDWFGYIYNASRLKDGAFTRDDFYRKDMSAYDSMEYIAKYLTSAKITPFGKPDFSDTSDAGLAALLSTVMQDPDQMRSFIDLYTKNSLSTTDALNAFKSSKIVFYAATTASFDEALTLGIDKLELLPAFTDGSDAMHYTCDYFWVVNGQGYDPDIQETVAFLNWMVTADQKDGAPIDRFGLLSPYKSATVAHNALEKLLRTYMAEEPAKLVFNNSCVPQEKFADFCAALATYYAKPNDTNWEAVVALMKS